MDLDEDGFEDCTEGYQPGQPCPEGCGGIVIHCRGENVGGDPEYFSYAQCSRCSWSTF